MAEIIQKNPTVQDMKQRVHHVLRRASRKTTDFRFKDLHIDLRAHRVWRAGQEGKTLELAGAPDVTLVCDRVWMREALGNLVKNALDHTRAGDTVRIEWKAFAATVQITVRDTGSGICPEDLPHIFKRFYRSRFSRDSQGVGLGLPLAKAIVEAHDGTIQAESEPGRGTVFTLRFWIPAKL